MGDYSERFLKLIAWGLLALLVTGGASSASAKVVYVNANATGANSGASWTDAYTDLQLALAAAQFGDEIWVAAGTYKPTTGTDRTKSFVMTAGVGIYGGFAGGETDPSERDWTTHETILSGDIGTTGSIVDNSYHVVAGGFQSVLDGVTITGGNSPNNGGGMINDTVSPAIANCVFSGNTASNGAGMYNRASSPSVMNCDFSSNSAVNGSGGYGGGMYNTGGSPTVSNCSFAANTAINGLSGGGGGIYDTGSSPIVTNCTFAGNLSYAGGGMLNESTSSPNVTNCRFTGNSAHDGGGGIKGFAVVTNCTFTGNSTDGLYGGGGIFIVGTATNCIFSNNTATGGNGGGIYTGGGTVRNCIFISNQAVLGGAISSYSTSLDLDNSTFTGNSATDHGGALFFSGTGSAIITNSIFWNNSSTVGPEIYKGTATPTFRNCDIRGSGGSGASWNPALGTDGGGNIMADPLFVSAANPAGLDGLWRTNDDGLALTSASLCIDAGTTTSAPLTDILGYSRVGRPDIGAYEYQGSVTPPNPPSAPVGHLLIGYTLDTPSTSSQGQPITYTYEWISDHGDNVIHGPKPDTTDLLTEMNLVSPGETWTITVTPHADNVDGHVTTARIKILTVDPNSGVPRWILYK